MAKNNASGQGATRQGAKQSSMTQTKLQANNLAVPEQQNAVRDIQSAPADKDQWDPQRLAKLYKETNLDPLIQKEQANDVDFERLFQDHLPKDAVALCDFLRKYKEKDESREFDIEQTKIGAEQKLKWAHDFIKAPGQEKVEISPWMQADTEVYNAYLLKKKNLV